MTDRPPYDALLARLEKERARHQSCAALSRTDEERIAHSGMAAGFLHAAIHLVEETEGPGAARQYMERTTDGAGVAPTPTPGPDLYFCPTAKEVESGTHGGFDQCCGQTDLHVPLPDSPGTDALSELLSQVQRQEYADLTQARETARCLNRRAQGAESRLAAIERAVNEWKVSDRGTYVPLRTVVAIARVMGVQVDEERLELHAQRVEQAEAAVERVRVECDAIARDVRGKNPVALAGFHEANARIRTALDGPPAEQTTREAS